jgi:hypothetical protein
MKEKHALDARYGKIGIRAVVAAVRYTSAAGASSRIPSSRGGVQPEKAQPNPARCGLQLLGQKLEVGMPAAA